MAGISIDDDRVRRSGAPESHRSPWRVLAASVLLHLLLLAVALRLAPEPTAPVPTERTVRVEILAEPAPLPARRDGSDEEPVAREEPAAPPRDASRARAGAGGEVVRARTMRSEE
ncbi:hypothetical protein EJC49_19215, partial [Aquibium carbonis]